MDYKARIIYIMGHLVRLTMNIRTLILTPQSSSWVNARPLAPSSMVSSSQLGCEENCPPTLYPFDVEPPCSVCPFHTPVLTERPNDPRMTWAPHAPIIPTRRRRPKLDSIRRLNLNVDIPTPKPVVKILRPRFILPRPPSMDTRCLPLSPPPDTQRAFTRSSSLPGILHRRLMAYTPADILEMNSVEDLTTARALYEQPRPSISEELVRLEMSELIDMRLAACRL